MPAIVVGAARFVVPQSVTGTSSVGTPTLNLTIHATGLAQTTAVSSAPLVTQAGVAASSSVGIVSPVIPSAATSSSTFGGITTICPSGISCGTTVSSVPIVSPHGVAAAFYGIYDLFDNLTPSVLDNAFSPSFTYGTRFFTDVAGYATAIRFYKGGTAGGSTHTVALYNTAGVLLASKDTSGEPDSGWHTTTLDTPIAITANTRYTAAVFFPSGHGAYTPSFFTNQFDNGLLHAYADGAGFNGVFNISGALTYPTNHGNENYYIDILFNTHLYEVSVVIPTGSASSPVYGGETLVIPLGIAAPGVVGTATATNSTSFITLTPTGVSQTTAVGAPTLVLEATGLAQSTALNTVPLVVPAGIAEVSAIGASTLQVPGGNILPAGVVQSSALGGVPLMVPAGVQASLSEGSVPVAVPAGIPASSSIGSTGAAVPAGYQNALSLGATSGAAPSGQQSASALGSTGAAVPSGSSVGFGYGVPDVTMGSVTLSISGDALPIAFGTPGVVLTVTPTVQVTQLAGLGLAKKSLEELIAHWHYLQKLRKKQEKRLETVAKAAKKVRSEVDEDNFVEVRAALVRYERLTTAGLAKWERIREEEAKTQARIAASAEMAQLGDGIRSLSAEIRREIDKIENAIESELQIDDEESILMLM